MPRRWTSIAEFARALFHRRKLAATAQGTFNWPGRPCRNDRPEKFGIMVARNAGMNADVFSVESEALSWLLNAPGK